MNINTIANEYMYHRHISTQTQYKQTERGRDGLDSYI